MAQQKMTDEALKQWKKKRTSTFMIYCLVYLLSGMHTAFMNATIWIYVTRQIVNDNPYFVFGMINAILFLPSVILNPLIAYFGDKFRRPKIMLFLTNTLVILGSLLYMIYYSAWYPITGTCLLGFRFSIRPILVGEIARSYSPDELVKKLSLFSNFFYVGLCPTSIILIFFGKTDINVGGLHIQYGNISSIFLIALAIIIQVLAVFYVHDLSKEYDLKQEEVEKVENSHARKSLLKEETPNHAEKLQRLFTSFDVVLSYCLALIFGYAEVSMLKYIPIVILTKHGYSITVLNIGLFLQSLMSIGVIVVIVRVSINSKTAYYICIVAFLAMIIMGFVFMLMKPTNTYTINWILAMLVYILFSVFYLAEDVFLLCITAKLVKSDIQSFAESFRMSCRSLALMLAGLSIDMIVHYYSIFYLTLSVLILILLGLMVYRKATLQNPVPSV